MMVRSTAYRRYTLSLIFGLVFMVSASLTFASDAVIDAVFLAQTHVSTRYIEESPTEIGQHTGSSLL